MKRRLFSLLLGALLALSSVGTAFANNTGYEGQPGGQSNGSGGGNNGYEGQPGNQSH